MPVLHFRPVWLLVLCSLSGPVAAQATHTIWRYDTKDLTIEVGDTVVFRNNWNPYVYSQTSHNVIADDLSFTSPTGIRYVYPHTFTQAGEILYHCSIHSAPGRDRGQFENGRIIVLGGDGGSASNLALQRVQAASGNYKPGDTIPVDLTIENAGGQASGAYSVTYYASPDAWIDASKKDAKDQQVGIVGYEIPFNRHFYQYQPPRDLLEIDADLDAVSAEIMQLLQEVHS